VKLAEEATPLLVTQGNREANLRVCEKGTHSPQGIQATASKAWESVKRGAIRSLAARFQGTVDNCMEPGGPERGARSLRGEHFEGR